MNGLVIEKCTFVKGGIFPPPPHKQEKRDVLNVSFHAFDDFFPQILSRDVVSHAMEY